MTVMVWVALPAAGLGSLVGAFASVEPVALLGSVLLEFVDHVLLVVVLGPVLIEVAGGV